MCTCMQMFTAHTENESLWEGLLKMGQVMHSLLQFHDISCVSEVFGESRCGLLGLPELHSSGESQLMVSQVLTFLAGRVLRQWLILCGSPVPSL